MCGVAGIVDLACGTSPDALSAAVPGMADTLTHRGPDDAGVWVDAARGLALGHRRLSILDVSPKGHQPMVSHDGRHVLAYNGENLQLPVVTRRARAARAQVPWWFGYRGPARGDTPSGEWARR